MLQKKQYILVSVFIATLATGCGAKKVSSSNESRGVTSTTTNKLGECNRINGGHFNLTGQVGTYYSPSTGAYRADYLNVNLTSVPAELFTSDTLKIQFFRWSEKAVGQKTINQIPTRFYFVDKLTGQVTQSNSYDQLSKSVLTAVRSFYGSSWYNVTLAQFFQRTMFVLTGVDLTYDAIEVRLYDTAVSTTPKAKVDVLLPAFVADPNIYKQYNPYPDLYTIHPNYPIINSGASENDYFEQIETICRELAGIGVRVPASEQKLNTNENFWDKITNQIKIFGQKLLSIFS